MWLLQTPTEAVYIKFWTQKSIFTQNKEGLIKSKSKNRVVFWSCGKREERCGVGEGGKHGWSNIVTSWSFRLIGIVKLISAHNCKVKKCSKM
jgi:hypothetical protein